MVKKIALFVGVIIFLLLAGTVGSWTPKAPLMKNPEWTSFVLMCCALVTLRIFRKSLK